MSRDFLPAPVEFPGGRRRKPKRRRHRSHRSHRSSSEGRGSSRPEGRHRSDASVLTEDPDGIAPLEPQPNRPPRRRRKRGIGHRYRKWRSRSKRKKYKVFMGGRGASAREIQRRYERSRKRRKRLVVGAVTAVVLGAFGVAMGDAYLQASRVLDKVRASGESLKQVRSNLIRGKLPPEDAFASAAKAIGEAQEQVDVARPTWGVVRVVPFLGLPVSRHRAPAGGEPPRAERRHRRQGAPGIHPRSDHRGSPGRGGGGSGPPRGGRRRRQRKPDPRGAQGAEEPGPRAAAGGWPEGGARPGRPVRPPVERPGEPGATAGPDPPGPDAGDGAAGRGGRRGGDRHGPVRLQGRGPPPGPDRGDPGVTPPGDARPHRPELHPRVPGRQRAEELPAPVRGQWRPCGGPAGRTSPTPRSR